MVEFIAWPALLIGLYALAIVGWPDVLRVVQGTHKAVGKVARHKTGPDGFTAVYEFDYRGVIGETDAFTAFAEPKPPVGSTAILNYPSRRPDLARTERPFARTLMYLGFAAWLGFFSDLLFRWL